MPIRSHLAALVVGAAILVAAAYAAPAHAECDVANAGLEELIAKTPSLQKEANAQVVRDLRTLRDAAIVLETYQHPEECRRLVSLARDLAANPVKAVEASGDTDEEAAERIAESRKPKSKDAPDPKAVPEKAAPKP